jgi:serine/threonine protein kinase
MDKYCPKCFKKYPQDAERCPEDGSYLVSTTDRDLTGDVLDERYTILERIGRGGMGVVYKAEQQLIKRIVALKVLRRDIVQDESAVKRFLNEARAIASLDSRHTVTLHDFGVTRDGLLYYTMELLKGRPLARIIRDEAPVDHVRAAHLLLQACRSLEEAHEHNILHRDIKPDNLFVTVKKGREELKVLDFGIAKLVGDASMDTVTRTGMIIGTPQYLSPEQALGNPVVPASDLYSLAIVFYEMLAGVPPFQDETPMKTMWAHIRDPVPPLTSKNPKVQVPRSIEAFLTRALEKEPGKRFPTTVAFRDALRKAIEDHDASPETVALPSLSTTGEGLRLKTQAWDGRKVADGGLQAEGEPKDAGADEARGTQALDVGALGEPRSPDKAEQLGGTAREKRQDASPPETDSAGVQPGFAPVEKAAAPKHKSPPREGQLQKPASIPVAAKAEQKQQPEPDRQEEVPSPEPDSLGQELRVAGPGSDTLALVLPRRMPLVWGAGAAVGLAVLVGLVVWAPWKEAPSTELAVGGGAVAEASGTQPVEHGDVVAAVPAAGDTIKQDAAVEEDQLSVPTDAIAALPHAEDTAVAHGGAGLSDSSSRPGPVDASSDSASASNVMGANDSSTAGHEPVADYMEPESSAGSAVAGGKQALGVSSHGQRPEGTDSAPFKAGTVEAKKKAADEDQRKTEEQQAKRKADIERRRKAEMERKRKEEAKREAEAARRAEAEAERKAEDARRREEDRSKVSRAERLVSDARSEMGKGRYEKALDKLNEAASSGGETSEVRNLRTQCYAGIKSREVKKLLAQARAALGRKEFDSCMSAAAQAGKLDSGNREAARLLKECKEKKDLEGMKF